MCISMCIYIYTYCFALWYIAMHHVNASMCTVDSSYECCRSYTCIICVYVYMYMYVYIYIIALYNRTYYNIT